MAEGSGGSGVEEPERRKTSGERSGASWAAGHEVVTGEEAGESGRTLGPPGAGATGGGPEKVMGSQCPHWVHEGATAGGPLQRTCSGMAMSICSRSPVGTGTEETGRS